MSPKSTKITVLIWSLAIWVASAQNPTQWLEQAELAEASYLPEKAADLYQKAADAAANSTQKTIASYKKANVLLSEKRKKEALTIFRQVYQESQAQKGSGALQSCFGWGAGYRWYQQRGESDSATFCINQLKQSLTDISGETGKVDLIQQAQAHQLYAQLTEQYAERKGQLFSAYYCLEKDGQFPLPMSLKIANALLLDCILGYDPKEVETALKGLKMVKSKLKNPAIYPYLHAQTLVYEALLYTMPKQPRASFEQLMSKAEEWIRANNLSGSPLHAEQLHWCAATYKDLFIDYPRASGYFRKLDSIYQQKPHLAEPLRQAGMYRNMGYMQMDNKEGNPTKNFKEGFELVKKAWQMQLTDSFKQLQPPFYPDLSQRSNLNINFQSCLLTLSALHYGYQRIYDVDKSLFNKLALIKTIEATETLLKGQLSRTYEEGLQRTATHQTTEHYFKKATTYRDFYNHDHNLSHLGVILEAMQLANSRQAGIRSSRTEALKAANGTAEEIAELEQFAKLIRNIQGKLSIAQKEQEQANIPQLVQQLSQANQQQQDYIEQLKRKYPVYNQLITQVPALSLEQIQPMLKQSALIITMNARFLNIQLVITSDTVLMVDKYVDRDKELLPLVNNLSEMLKNPPPNEQTNSHNQELALLLTRAKDSFFTTQALFESKGIKHIIIVPDQLTASIPFELLPTETIDPNSPYQSWPYAVKKYSFQYLPTLPFWTQAKEKSRQNHNNGKILAFAPTYQKGLKNPNRDRRNKIVRNNLVELFGTKEELDNLKNYYFGDFLSDEAAHEAAFKQKSSEPYAIIHLAMHGLLDQATPELSALAFSETSDTTEDNFLTSLEIANLSNRAQLVVLSACETGTGKQQTGEGVLSLAQYFLYGGAPAVIATRWQVNDQSTAFIMQNFYKYLYESQTIKSSLRQSQLDYLQQVKGRSAHPFYWAAFINVGHTDKTVFIAHNNWRQKYYIGAGISLLLLIGIGFKYLRTKEKIA